MNTTIVARLYHSEAIRLQDGRVMVSGSDPEDNVNPEEPIPGRSLRPALSPLGPPAASLHHPEHGLGLRRHGPHNHHLGQARRTCAFLSSAPSRAPTATAWVSASCSPPSRAGEARVRSRRLRTRTSVRPVGSSSSCWTGRRRAVRPTSGSAGIWPAWGTGPRFRTLIPRVSRGERDRIGGKDRIGCI